MSADLLAISDERDLATRVWLAAWRDGWQAGHAAAGRRYSEGYAHAVAEIKAAEHGLVRLVRGHAETETARWTLRGERRTRATFGQPHPADYPGRDGAA